MAKKYVYLFTEGNATMRELLGGKGANLAEMTNLGLPVPQGFTISTEACTQYYEDGRKINDEIQAQINEHITKMEAITGKKFGDKENPLLVSVRSGARASMPGMMDTILNLGLNEEVVEVVAKKTGNERWARDCYRRFIQMYSDVVMEVGKKYFEELIDKMKAEIKQSEKSKYTETEINSDVNCVKETFKERDNNINLLSVSFDEEESNAFLDGYHAAEKFGKKNVIVLLCDYTVYDSPGAYSKGTYENWAMILTRESGDKPWTVSDQGY